MTKREGVWLSPKCRVKTTNKKTVRLNHKDSTGRLKVLVYSFCVARASAAGRTVLFPNTQPLRYMFASAYRFSIFAFGLGYLYNRVVELCILCKTNLSIRNGLLPLAYSFVPNRFVVFQQPLWFILTGWKRNHLCRRGATDNLLRTSLAPPPESCDSKGGFYSLPHFHRRRLYYSRKYTRPGSRAGRETLFSKIKIAMYKRIMESTFPSLYAYTIPYCFYFVK